MGKNQETGYAKNVANLGIIVSAVEGFGLAYKPSMERITLVELQKRLAVAVESLENLNTKLGIQKDVMARRVGWFKNLKPLSTRLVAAAKASGISAAHTEKLKSFNRQIQGPRTVTKAVAPETMTFAEPQPDHISRSHGSYDRQVDHFDKLVKLLMIFPEYQPNEEELQIVQLQDLHNKMKENNNLVVQASRDIKNSRIERNAILFKENVGLHDLSVAIKNYVKSIYGSSNPNYKKISKIKIQAGGE